MSNPLLKNNSKTIRSAENFADRVKVKIEPHTASKALVLTLEYLKERLDWSGAKIAKTLHIPTNTINTWLKNKKIPIHGHVLSPDIQAITHLIAIHRSLEAMFNESLNQQAWLATYHPELQAVPQELMAESIEKLIFVRQYLDYIRGKGA